MPGMDIDDNANIKYNNKVIENIMIEEDVAEQELQTHI